MITRIVLELLVLSFQLAASLACLPTEFTCESGQCVDGARFCDGTVDCADGTDEHHGCTNCNRTYYGVSGVKYPLRLNEPVRQASGSVCTLSFIAAGGLYGDIVEITFLSFHIGVYQLESSMCYKGYMEVEDKQMYPLKKRSVRFASSSRKKSSVTSKRKEPLKVRWDRASSTGSFCGKMIGDSATFYSSGDKVNLNIFVSSHVSTHSAAPRLYLTYRFLRRDSLPLVSFNTTDNFPQTNCDVTLTNCSSQHCVVRSPNYPGFYLRNVTCIYRIREDNAPAGHLAQIEIFQRNEFKINVLSGHTSNGRFKSGILTSDCAGDVIRIYDGGTTSSPLLASFCGSGSLPVIRSSGPEVIIESQSVPFQPLFSSKFELGVRIHFVSKTRFRINSEKCVANFDGSRSKTGVLRVPDHSVAANTTCTFRITGRRPSDRIWLYFVVYSVPDLHPWSDSERCDVAELRIIYPKFKLRHQYHHSQRYRQWDNEKTIKNNTSKTLVGVFCEKNSPLQCGHASDFEDFIPSRPCDMVTESYLSAGPELILELTFLRAMAIHGSSPHFVARYEVVEVDHPLVPDSACTVLVRSSEGKDGWLENPRNLFLYGRGGATNLTCKYELRGDESERIRVIVREVHFLGTNSCLTTYNKKTQRYSCSVSHIHSQYSRRKLAIINVTELWHDLKVPVGCICDGYRTSSTMVLEAVSNKLDLEFLVTNMESRDDFRTFRFEVAYEFVALTGCQMNDQQTAGVEGQVTFTTHDATRCRWLLVALPSRSLYITIRGRKFDDSCQNKYLFYDFFDQEPFETFCASESEEYQSVFTKSWSSQDEGDGQVPSQTGLTLLEVTAGEAGSFSVHWVEVTRRSRNMRPGGLEQGHPLTCELECPELDACISSDLACDGRNHCPETGADELPDRCAQFPVMTLAFSAAATVLAALLCCLLAFAVRYHHLHRRVKTHVPSCPMQHQHPLTAIIKQDTIRHSISERYA